MGVQFMGALQRDERRLFHDRLRQVDRHVMTGLSKMTWNRPKAVLDQYFNDALWWVFWQELSSFLAESRLFFDTPLLVPQQDTISSC